MMKRANGCKRPLPSTLVFYSTYPSSRLAAKLQYYKDRVKAHAERKKLRLKQMRNRKALSEAISCFKRKRLKEEQRL